MPAKSQRRGAIVAAMVAVLRFVGLWALGTGIVKESELVVSLAFRLTSIVVKVEWSTRIKELAMLVVHTATEETSSCCCIVDRVIRRRRRLGTKTDRSALLKQSSRNQHENAHFEQRGERTRHSNKGSTRRTKKRRRHGDDGDDDASRVVLGKKCAEKKRTWFHDWRHFLNLGVEMCRMHTAFLNLHWRHTGHFQYNSRHRSTWLWWKVTAAKEFNYDISDIK
jgi:hypothetical protein